MYDSSSHLIPVFVPGDSQIENWLPVRGATLDVDTNSLLRRRITGRSTAAVSADLGVRYERVRSEATGNLVGVDTDTIVPRLALAWDVARRRQAGRSRDIRPLLGPLQQGADRRQQQRRQPRRAVWHLRGPARTGPKLRAGVQSRQLPDRRAAGSRPRTSRWRRGSRRRREGIHPVVRV